MVSWRGGLIQRANGNGNICMTTSLYPGATAPNNKAGAALHASRANAARLAL